MPFKLFTSVNFPRIAVVGSVFIGGALSAIAGGSGTEILIASMIGPGTALLSNTAINLIRKAKGEQPLNLSASGIEVGDLETLGSLLAGAAVSKGVLHEQSPVGVLKQTVAITGTYLVGRTLHSAAQQIAGNDAQSMENNGLRKRKKLQ
ncbi:MAG: hypothetical protein BGO43_12725 [Gammaproteobacteria bacterium 39-13]|nr:hypothetical protein [Gammaproteobacteria bacterium]OJV90008.1 MAG: hypothetical protein BGO43_12725 [Gammaproteobacteria bacterium 39-13]